uniref:PDZ domain-containing protein n=1 Tax=Fagus sylvatica TaxID=28930 RepID=A0A2N9FBJ5_FAGSY
MNIVTFVGSYGITNGKSIGSGTIIDEDGTILTCAHVVVDFPGLRCSAKGKGTMVNADLHSGIAIVKIHSKTPLPTATLGSSSKLRPGTGLLPWDVHFPFRIPSQLRKLLVFNRRSSLLRIVAIATAGSGLLYATTSSNSRVNVAVKVPAVLQESLLLPRRITLDVFPHPSFLSSDQWPSGILPLFSSRVGSVPSSDIKKDTSGAVGGDPKPCCNCLGRDTIANAAAGVGPAVVNLSVPQGSYGITNGKSIGSGTIIDEDGTILTCAHVVVDFPGMRGSAKGKVDVTLQDGRTFEGTVVNADLHSDIAIVKIHSKTPLPTATLGSSSKLRPGDWVVALGCPLSLQNTITAGIVSCVDRKSSDLGLGGIRREYLQTDCAINVGNSGGPLVNIDGEIVGVNIMKVLAADGLSFAVPIDSVSKIILHFKKSGKDFILFFSCWLFTYFAKELLLSATSSFHKNEWRVRRVVRPWLGLKMIDLNEMIIAQLKERDATFPNVNKGVLVPMVTPGSPTDRAGFRPGDVVIEFDGKPVESIKEIIEIMGDRVGVPMKAVVKRANDNLVTMTVNPKESKPDM